MRYHDLNEKSMPPINRHSYFILWRGAKESDGGVPSLAKRVAYDGKPPYIRYVTMDGWHVLAEEDYKDCRWATLEPPD